MPWEYARGSAAGPGEARRRAVRRCNGRWDDIQRTYDPQICRMPKGLSVRADWEALRRLQEIWEETWCRTRVRPEHLKPLEVKNAKPIINRNGSRGPSLSFRPREVRQGRCIFAERYTQRPVDIQE